METQKVDISFRDVTLKGAILSNLTFNEKRPVILVIHGWTSSMKKWPPRVEPLVDMGYLVLLFDMRAHGETGGEIGAFSAKDNLDDCIAAYDYLLKLENADENNISVLGSSYGGYLASLLTAQRPVHHLVLNVPALYPNAMFDNAKDLKRSEDTINYRQEYHAAKDDFALQAIHDFQGDLLLISAEKDELLSHTVTENYKNAIQVTFTYKEIKGSDHAMYAPGANEERIQIQTEWFKQFI